jgi:SAM-dependent methyltransferase
VSDGDLRALAARTRQTYEKHAARFDAERPKRLHEKAWLDRFAALLPSDGAILDLGCGAGDPIAAYFTAAGFTVTGVDVAEAMIALAKARFPAGDWRHGDMRTLALDEQFDGIIAWNSFFHLTPEEQHEALTRIAAHLAPGGALLLTVGPAAGEVVGHVGGDEVYHSSLNPEEYAAILERHGISVVQFVAEDPECGLQTVLLAQRVVR